MFYYLVAILSGVVNKMYDDLSDNPLLGSFKTPVLMEFLKGLHYISLTAVSLHEPVFFMILYAVCTFNSIADPNAWSSPYEYSLPYSLALLYLLVDYTDLPPLTIYDILLIFGILSTNILEPLVLPYEFSILKLIVRAYIACTLLCMMALPLFSVSIKYVCAYYVGYFLASTCSQYYSVQATQLKSNGKYKHEKRRRSKHRSTLSPTLGGLLRIPTPTSHGACSIPTPL